MVRPFYRSRLFWLGLPGAAFLWWGWWDSIRNVSKIAWLGADREMNLSLHSSWLHLGFAPYGGNSPPRFMVFRDGAETMEILNEGLENPEAWFRWFWWDLSGSFAGDLAIAIPLWTVVTGYVVSWISVLIWWQRRKTRLLRLRTGMNR